MLFSPECVACLTVLKSASFMVDSKTLSMLDNGQGTSHSTQYAGQQDSQRSRIIYTNHLTAICPQLLLILFIISPLSISSHVPRLIF